MRKMFWLITLQAALPVLLLAQNAPVSTNNPPLPPPGDARLQQTLPKPADADAVFREISPLAAPTTGLVSKVAMEGALVRATRAGQPWQAINPFAPKEFGDGNDNVSINPTTGQASGIVLLSVRFGKLGGKRK